MAKTRSIPIRVSSRVLRHISRGIYRTPAGALKELVSNSYDAAALHVTINTGWPSIKQIVITDDGHGMTGKEFELLVQNIGLSDKTAGEEFKVRGAHASRTVIGHYGIGLLAVGQLASRMTIRSKRKGTLTGFQAELDFDQFEMKKHGDVSRASIKDERQIEARDPKLSSPGGRSFAIGTCTLKTEQYAASKRRVSFTKIELTRLRGETVSKIKGSYRDDINPQATLWQEYSSTYDDLLRLLRENERLARQGIYPYEKLIWDLGVYCPVAYPKRDEFLPKRKLGRIAKNAAESRFSVKVDGMEILKPFESAFFDSEDYRKYGQIWTWMNEKYAQKSRGPQVSGYLIYKPSIRPVGMQGVLVRQGGVAIGMYDSTYLQYPYNEGFKFNQLTGELFATGLSGALNIDRNSFNETDDRYVQLCRWFHEKLREEVFPRFKVLQGQSAAKRRRENKAHVKDTLESVSRDLGKRTAIRFRSLGKESPLMRRERGELIINTDHSDASFSSAKREKILLASALVLTGRIKPTDLDEIEQILASARKAGKEE